MNIYGHEIERRQLDSGEHRVFIDGQMSDFAGSSDPDYYTRTTESIRVEVARRVRQADDAALVAGFVRREAAEKAAADAARELDRRTRIAFQAWYGHTETAPWESQPKSVQESARRVVRALDADAAEQEALSE